MPSEPAVASASTFSGLLGPIIPGFFGVDQLSLTFLSGLSVLAVLLILSAPATRRFFAQLALLIFFFAGAFGVVTATNLLTFFGSWELGGLFAWGIGQLASARSRGDRPTALPPAGVLGSVLMLIGFVFLAANRHGLVLGPAGPGLPRVVPLILLLAITLRAYGLLSGVWLSHPEHRFNPAGATLAGAGLLGLVVYPFLRLFGPVLGSVPGWREPVSWLAAAVAVVAALAALGECSADAESEEELAAGVRANWLRGQATPHDRPIVLRMSRLAHHEADVRRALAYGAFSQFWLLVLVFTVGTPAATLGAISGALADALAFTGLFLCLGVAEESTAQAAVRRVGGLAQRLPLTAGLFVGCSISLLGVPPLGGFTANGLISLAIAGSPTLALVWMAVTGLTLAYLARLFVGLFLGAPRGPIRTERRRSILVLSGGILTTLVLLGTLGTELLAQLEPLSPVIHG